MDAHLESLLVRYHGLTAAIAPLKAQLEPLVEAERALRAAIIDKAFPLLSHACMEYMNQTGTDDHRPDCKCGREGVNYLDLPSDWKLKGTVVIDRKVDEAAVDAVSEELQKQLVNPDNIFRWKPDLSTKTYKDLPKDIRKIVDQALIIKPGSPKLEFIAPKPQKG